jgi:hypothetical protein
MANPSTPERFGLRVDRVWIWKEGQETRAAEGPRPRPEAIEYMRVMSRQEMEKLAGDEGVDVQQMLNSMQRTIDGQRANIARLSGEREPPHCPTCSCGMRR